MARRRDSAPGRWSRAAWWAIAAGVLLLAAQRNGAQSNELNVQFHTFQDSRGVTVLTPTVDLSQDFTARTRLRANYGVDAISAASDSCARCHREGVKSLRQYGGLSIIRSVNAWKLTAGGSYSKENFFQATTFLTSLTRDLNKGAATVAGGYAFSLNQPTLHPTQTVQTQHAHDAYVNVTQTLTKTTIAQVGYELAQINGYQDNPFLRTSVNGVMTLGHVPDARRRQTFSARLRQALPANTYLDADYRRYVDDWQVASNGFNIGVSHDFASRVLAGFSYRAYDQRGAYFYQAAYVDPVPQFFTGDFRLEPFASTLYTGKVAITPKRAWFGLPAGTALTLQYERYRADTGFRAAIFSTGLRIPLGAR